MAPPDPGGTPLWLRLLSRLPWWMGLAGAALAYLGLHRLALRWDLPDPGADSPHLIPTLAGLGQWLIPAALLVASGVAGYRRYRALRLHRDLAADPVGATLRDLGRGDFEALVGEAFRRLGYQVSEPLGGQAAGVGALLLSRADGRALVQARYWQAWRIGAAEVQGLIAAMAASGVGRGYLVIPGEFGRDARRLAEGRPIELIDAAGLAALVQTGRGAAPRPTARPPGRWRAYLPRRWPRLRVKVPWRPLYYLTGVLLAGAAILSGFDWIRALPDKRIAPSAPPVVEPLPQGPIILVPEPEAEPAPPAPPPPPGLGGLRSAKELDAAFDAFYIPPPGCANPGSHADLVACANDRIRARKGYMAAREPQQPEPEPEQPPEQQPEEEEPLAGDPPGWDDEDAINALAPPSPPPSPPPDQVETEVEGGAAPPEATEPPTKKSAPKRVEPQPRDPEGTYRPYDPKAPWEGR